MCKCEFPKILETADPLNAMFERIFLPDEMSKACSELLTTSVDTVWTGTSKDKQKQDISLYESLSLFHTHENDYCPFLQKNETSKRLFKKWFNNRK